MNSEPKILYKYRSLTGDNFKFTHDIFIKNELYFSHPDQINDPFDCKILPHMESLTKEQLIERNKKADPKLLQKVGLTSQKSKEIILNTPLPILQKRLQGAFKRYQDVGILSLTENYSDILMWGHYADSHKGICIGFDYYGLSFPFRGTPLVPEEIKYPENNECPKWNPFCDDPTIQCDKIYFTKAIHWKYEKEWRVILPEHGRTLQKINPNTLVSVYLGCQITEGDKKTVINWCLQRKQKPKVYKLIKDDSSYSLKEIEISY